jgi:hypothetical protein
MGLWESSRENEIPRREVVGVVFSGVTRSWKRYVFGNLPPPQ